MTDLDRLLELHDIKDTILDKIKDTWSEQDKQEYQSLKSQLESKLARYDKLERDNGAREQCSAILIESYKEDIRKLQSQHTNLVKAIQDLGFTDEDISLLANSIDGERDWTEKERESMIGKIYKLQNLLLESTKENAQK